MANKLQFIHCNTLFETKEKAKNYIERIYDSQVLYAEPVVVRYGTVEDANVILGIGVADGTDTSYTNHVFYIDTNSIEESVEELYEAVAELSGKSSNLLEVINKVAASCGLDENYAYVPSENEIIDSANTIKEAIDLIADNLLNLNESAFQKISEADGNTIKLIDGGLFSMVDISYEPLSNKLVFTKSATSGETVTKTMQLSAIQIIKYIRYDSETNEIVIEYTSEGVDHELRIPVGDIFKEFVVANPSNITLDYQLNVGEEHNNILSGSVNISSDETNLLEDRDNYLYVSNNSRDIVYFTSNVQDAVLNAEHAIYALSGSIDTINGELSEIGEHLDRHDGEIVDIKEDITSLSSDVTNLSNKVDEFSEKMEDFEERIDGVEVKIGELSGYTRQNKEILDDHARYIGELSATVNTIKIEQEAQGKKIGEILNRLENIDKRLIFVNAEGSEGNLEFKTDEVSGVTTVNLTLNTIDFNK